MLNKAGQGRKATKPARVFVLFLLVISCFRPIFPLEPGTPLKQYIHESWGLEDGLPQNGVYSILQDKAGYLWLGTHEGLVRFEGDKFTVIDKSNTKELLSNIVMALYEDRRGILWIGTYGGGITCKKNSGFHHISSLQNHIDLKVRALCGDKEGNLWVGTDGDGLFTCRESLQSFVPIYDEFRGKRITSLCQDRWGKFWVGTFSGLYCISNKTVTQNFPGMDRVKNPVYAIFEDTKGRLWIGTNNELYCMEEQVLHAVGNIYGLKGNRINSFYEDRNNVLWLGGSKDLFRLKEGGFHSLAGDGNSVLEGQDILSIVEDREGSLWAGTGYEGLHRFRDGRFTTYTRSEGLSHNLVRCILQDRENNVWIGTNSGLNLIKTGKTAPNQVEPVLQGIPIYSLHQDHRGNLWIGCENSLKYLELPDNSKPLHLSPKDFWISNIIIRSIFVNPDGSMWVGTSVGLKYFKDGKLDSFPGQEKLDRAHVYAIHRDMKGRIWFVTSSGLYCLTSGRLRSYSKKDGLSNTRVLCIHEEKDGDIWIGSQNGLNRLRDNEILSITSRNGLFNDNIYQILEDNRCNFWISSNKGVYRVAKKDVEDFFDNKVDRVNCTSFSEADGMKSRECNGGGQPAGTRSSDGRLWFPTIKGIVVIDPGNLKHNSVQPPVIIESIVADGKKIDIAGGREKIEAIIPPGVKRMHIKYTALSFQVPGRVRFKIMLDGYDTGWSEELKSRSVDYTKLSPGSYTFRVIACNNDGVWNETGTAVSIFIKPTFFQTVWFYALCFIFLLLLIWSGIRFYVRNLKKRERQLRAKVKEKTGNLEERYNELATIQKIIENINRETRLDLLLDSLLKQVISLYPEADTAFYCLYDHKREVFKYVAAEGFPSGILDGFSLTYDEAVSRYGGGGRQLQKGIFILKDVNKLPAAEKLKGFRAPEVILVMEVIIAGKVEGYLIIENMTDANAFDNSNIQLLSTLREHAVSAISRARVMEELAAEKIKAESASLSKSKFIASMSHEIRTPMNAILGFTGILQDEINDPVHQDMLQTVSAAGNSLLQLINDILDIARIEAGKIELKPEPVCLASLIDEVKSIFALKVKEKALDFHVDTPGDIPASASLDPLRIRQMLINLVGNAIKFTHTGFIWLVLKVNPANCDPGHADIIFTIEDTGIGIPEDQQEAVFKAFKQQNGQKTSQYGGTGLGLSITELIVKSMGGDISVQSWPGKGSIFEILLPGVPVEFGPVWGGDVKPADFDPETIHFFDSILLVVDDNPENCQLIKQYLKYSDVTVIEASNGKEGLSLAYDYWPDIIIMDVNMPVMGGVEAAKKIKADRSFKQVPVILFSASVLKDQVEKYMALSGCDAFIRKPVNKTELFCHFVKFLPYKTAEGAVFNAVESDTAAEQELPLKPLDKDRIPELLSRLNGKFLQRWETVSENFVISDKEDFASRVRDLGNEFHMPHLTKWGEQLLEHLHQFDLEKINGLWDDFPNLTGRIESIAADGNAGEGKVL